MMRKVHDDSVLVNQSYAPQRVTGQQRYAREVAGRLLHRPQFKPIQPPGFWERSTLRVWLWLQLILPIAAGRAVLLSLTARAPLWRRKHVLVVHDLFVLTNPEWFSRRYALTHAPLLRAQLRSAAALVAVSQPVADELTGMFEGPIVVAPNAPSEVFTLRENPPRISASRPAEALAARGLTPGTYLLTVGSMDPRKNLPLLARAYGALEPSERAAHPLVVVGGANAVFRSEQTLWPSGVIDAGYVSDAELAELYAHAGAVVFVSKAEGFGLPLVEAVAAGAANLVISDIPVFRWICGDAAHYVDPNSESSITTGLRACLREPRKHSVELERFSWDATAEIIGGLCESVARSSR